MIKKNHAGVGMEMSKHSLAACVGLIMKTLSKMKGVSLLGDEKMDVMPYADFVIVYLTFVWTTIFRQHNRLCGRNITKYNDWRV